MFGILGPVGGGVFCFWGSTDALGGGKRFRGYIALPGIPPLGVRNPGVPKWGAHRCETCGGECLLTIGCERGENLCTQA